MINCVSSYPPFFFFRLWSWEDRTGFAKISNFQFLLDFHVLEDSKYDFTILGEFGVCLYAMQILWALQLNKYCTAFCDIFNYNIEIRFWSLIFEERLYIIYYLNLILNCHIGTSILKLNFDLHYALKKTLLQTCL